MDDCIDSLREANSLTAKDAMLWYNLIEIYERACKKTVFTSHLGFDRFIEVVLGLPNAPATIDKTADVLLASLH